MRIKIDHFGAVTRIFKRLSLVKPFRHFGSGKNCAVGRKRWELQLLANWDLFTACPIPSRAMLTQALMAGMFDNEVSSLRCFDTQNMPYFCLVQWHTEKKLINSLTTRYLTTKFGVHFKISFRKGRKWTWAEFVEYKKSLLLPPFSPL